MVKDTNGNILKVGDIVIRTNAHQNFIPKELYTIEELYSKDDDRKIKIKGKAGYWNSWNFRIIKREKKSYHPGWW